MTSVTLRNAQGATTKHITYEYDGLDRRIRRKERNYDPPGTPGPVVAQERCLYGTDVLKSPLPRIGREGQGERAGNGSGPGSGFWEVALVIDELTTYSGPSGGATLPGEIAHRFLNGPLVDQVFADETAVGDILWYVFDHQNTVRDVAVFDGTPGDQAEVVNHLTYDSFGNVVDADDPTTSTASDGDLPGTTGQHAPQRGYTGREPDAVTGLIYYRARWYDSAMGRFISEDPIGFSAGDANLSRYVGNSSPNAVDPSGLDWIWNWDWSTFGEGYANNLNPWGSSGQPPVDAGDRFLRNGQRGAVIVAGGAGGLAGGLTIAAGAGITAIGTTSVSALGAQVTAGAAYYGTQACAVVGSSASWLEGRPAIKSRLLEGLEGYLESGGNLYDAAASMVFGSAFDGAPQLLGAAGRAGSAGLSGLGLPGLGRPAGTGAAILPPGPAFSVGRNPSAAGRRIGINPSTGKAEIVDGKLVDNGLSLTHDPVTQCSPADAPKGVQANKAAGDAWEAELLNNQLPKTQTQIQPQITIKSGGPSGKKVRLDAVGTDSATGGVKLTDGKASVTAPLTPNQKVVYPELEVHGGTVVGKGKPPYAGGTTIPPTNVDIIRRP